MEADCKYVSSRGLLKSCDIRPTSLVSGVSRCMNMRVVNRNHKGHPLLYICNAALAHFISALLPKITYKFILLTGDSDTTVPGDILSRKQYLEFVADPRLVKWYCQNWVGIHPKVFGLPIGLDYHTLATPTRQGQRHWWGASASPAIQERLLLRVAGNAPSLLARRPICYSTSHHSPTERCRYRSDRVAAERSIPSELVFYEPKRIKRLRTWVNQSKYAFVTSPHGNGLDCHRTWEALCLGCIPVVKRSPICRLFEDLPVLVVESWGDVTKALLDSTVVEFSSRSFDIDKLTLNYWVKRCRGDEV